MAIEFSTGKKTASAQSKVLVSAIFGLVALFLAGNFINWKVAPLIAWDTIAIIFTVWTWLIVWPLDGQLTSKHALREDPSRAASDLVILFASIASLAAVGFVLAGSTSGSELTKALNAALGVVSVILSWLTVHTIFTLRYAELYYYESPGGVNFEGTKNPAYSDFAYLAFTLGMTFQVSDTGFDSQNFRKVALRHALISYLFGTVIVATTINLIAGLNK
jgi:uncharacterized membrane protein